jgi:hypothetical protein
LTIDSSDAFGKHCVWKAKCVGYLELVYYRLVFTLERKYRYHMYKSFVPTVWYFEIVLTVWYFRIVPTVWYFRIVPTVWYFRIVPTVWYF